VQFNAASHILQIIPTSLFCFSKINLRTRRLISYLAENTLCLKVIRRLMLLRDIIAVYSEKNTKFVCAKCQQSDIAGNVAPSNNDALSGSK
jgi:hypothetical protein